MKKPNTVIFTISDTVTSKGAGSTLHLCLLVFLRKTTTTNKNKNVSTFVMYINFPLLFPPSLPLTRYFPMLSFPFLFSDTLWRLLRHLPDTHAERRHLYLDRVFAAVRLLLRRPLHARIDIAFPAVAHIIRIKDLLIFSRMG